MTETRKLTGYSGYSEEGVDHDKAETLRAFGAKFIKLIQGKNIVRILPPLEGKKSPFTVIWQHFINRRPVLCPKRNAAMGVNAECAACDHAWTLRRSGNPGVVKEGDELAVRRQWVAAALHRNGEDVQKDSDGRPILEVRTLAVGRDVVKAILNQHRELLDCESPADTTDPLRGCDYIIEKQGSGREGTTYAVTLRGMGRTLHPMDVPPKGSGLKPDFDLMQKWLDERIDYDSWLERLPSNEDILRALHGDRQDTAGGSHAPPALEDPRTVQVLAPGMEAPAAAEEVSSGSLEEGAELDDIPF